MRLDKTGWKMTVSHTWAFSLVPAGLPENTDLRPIPGDQAGVRGAAPQGKDKNARAPHLAQMAEAH
ncbi:hypothetical protein, partial [Nocardia cyriacigeorgica]|uniref:hypothetical protein n=1 Tax=Nocardia cyriacigeorgica TaxID=135487 RepID=UPI0032AED8E1